MSYFSSYAIEQRAHDRPEDDDGMVENLHNLSYVLPVLDLTSNEEFVARARKCGRI